MQDNKIHNFGEFDPGTANAESLERLRDMVVTDALGIIKGSVRFAYPDLFTPTPPAEQPQTAAPTDTVAQVAQFSANTLLSQQVRQP